jgi:hypothetical protein
MGKTKKPQHKISKINIYSGINFQMQIHFLHQNYSSPGWGEGDEKAITAKAINRVVPALNKFRQYILDEINLDLPAPELLPGPADGSIDCYWSAKRYEALMNIPEEGPLDYYVEIFGRKKLKGKLDIDSLDQKI